MYKNRINIVLIVLVTIITIISLRYGTSITDWWESLVYGKNMDPLSLVYFACYAGVIICVFMKYHDNK